MEELSVNIKICDRMYPMKVQAEEEVRVRKAGKLINERVMAYSEQFKIHDKQDLLAMAAFDCLVEMLENKSEAAHTLQAVDGEIKSFLELIEERLSSAI